MSDRSNRHLLSDRLIYAVIMLLPFVFLGWLFSFPGRSTYGFDYWHHHIRDQLELAFALKTGTFPLFIPGYFHGQSAFVLSEGQLFHPFFHIVRHLPGYWQGYAADWTMLLHLLGLAGAHAALFCFLTRSGIGRLLALFISTVTVYNLRMLFLSWFGSPLEAWSGHILLAAAIGCYYLRPTAWKGPLLMAGATFWLVVCGHPVWTFYGLITVAVFTLLLPFYLPLIYPNGPATGNRSLFLFWSRTAVFCGIGIMSAAAYLVPYYFDFVAGNAGIVDQEYQWSLSFTEPVGEFFHNFFLPLRTGYAMFAGTPLFTALVLMPIVKFSGVRIPAVIWGILGLVLLIFVYMQGGATPLHSWAWQYIPLHHMIRGPSRAAFALPLLFMMLLTWLLHKNPSRPFNIGGKQYRLSAAGIVGAAALFLLVLYPLCLPDSLMSDLAPLTRLNMTRLPAWAETLVFILGVTTFLTLVLYGAASGSRQRKAMMVLFAISCLHIFFIFLFNPLYFSPLAEKRQSSILAEMRAWKETSLNMQKEHYYLNPGRGSKVVNRQLENYFVETRLGVIYRKAVAAETLDEAYQILNRERRPEEVVIVNVDEEMTRLPDSRACKEVPDRVVLEYGSYNRLVFSVTACQPAFFVFAWPYTGHWTARVNGERADAFMANGVSHAVRIPAGTGTVEFRYRSRAALAGMIISCLTLALFGCWIGFMRLRKPVGHIVAIGVPVVSVLLFGLWYNSLYTGENLNTRYAWQTPPATAPENIAYGRPTAMSSFKKGDLWFPLRYSSRHAVDGNKSDPMVSSSHTDLEEDPWWQVDLQSPAEVKTVLIYLTPPYALLPFNRRPLWIQFSADGTTWQGQAIDTKEDEIMVLFEEPVTIRYLRIMASGRCVLSLREVEVYAD